MKRIIRLWWPLGVPTDGRVSHAILAAATAVFAGVFGPAGASAQDSAPVILSRKSAVGWSNVAELQATAQKGNPKACAQLGEMLLRGTNVPQDGPRALVLLEQAARAGEASAAFRIGMLLEDGDCVARDEARALAYLRAAAAGGWAAAFGNVGIAYSTARGVKRDYAEALAWLLLAKKHGVAGPTVEELQAHIKSLGHPEWLAAGERRAPEIERELTHGGVAALLPPPVVLTYLPAGSALAEPVAPPPDALGALPPPSLPPLPGWRNASPTDAAPEEEKPVKLIAPTGRILRWSGVAALERAAARGETDALAGLGQALLDGEILNEEVARAVTLLERAAQAGSGDAAQLLADLYTKGLRVPRDDQKAFAFTLQAARGGVKTAIYNLGALYANGTGTAADYTESLAWLLVAQHFNLDSGQAQRIRDYLAKADAKQIPLAERRAAGRIREIETVRENLPGL